MFQILFIINLILQIVGDNASHVYISFTTENRLFIDLTYVNGGKEKKSLIFLNTFGQSWLHFVCLPVSSFVNTPAVENSIWISRSVYMFIQIYCSMFSIENCAYKTDNLRERTCMQKNLDVLSTIEITFENAFKIFHCT